MKITFRLILAILAAAVALTACTKEITPNFENDKVNPEGSRVIAVSFGPQTKTRLDGLQPKFVDNDSILISNGVAIDTCDVEVEGNVATISTNLTGPLTAVYPYKAAKMNENDENLIDTVLVSTEQDGTFANANICMAESITDKAVFENKTAVFEITPPEGVTSFTIKSLNTIDANTGQRSTTPNAVAINTVGATDETQRVVTVSNDTLTTFYVSLVPGVKLSDLSFEYTTDDSHGAMKGIPMKDIKTAGIADATVANTKYTINNQNWHPYVTIGGKKWATRNVGATADTGTDSYGTYFAWGSVEKVYSGLSGNTFTFLSNNPDDKRYTGGWTPESGFDYSYCNTPYYDGSAYTYTEYTGTGTGGDSKTVLYLADDAAHVNWGGPWRMPTGGESSEADFTALANACKSDGYSSGNITPTPKTEVPTEQGVYYYDVEGDSGEEGLYFVADATHKLFFPAVGDGVGTTLGGVGSCGFYWSSTLGSSISCYAYSLYFYSGYVYPQYYNYRYIGFSIRPVADMPADPSEPSEPEEEAPATEMEEEVLF